MGRGKEEHIYYLKGPLWVPEHIVFCNSLNLWQSLVSDALLTALALYTERTPRLKGTLCTVAFMDSLVQMSTPEV